MLSLWQRRAHQKELQSLDKNIANYENTTTPITDREVVLFSFEEEKECHIADSYVEWVIDSATSYHAILNKEFFIV